VSGREVTPDVAEWLAYLRDLGVRDWHMAPASEPAPAAAQREAPTVASPPRPSAAPAPPRASAPSPAAPPKSAPIKVQAPPELFPVVPEGAGAATDPAQRLAQIRAELGDCTRCRLHERRTNIVFGVGSPHARLMFVGEGPGADEDAKGEPFVGRAGQKLNEMITSIGLQRAEVYIANVVKCRPPENREPLPDEVATCSPYLLAQIRAIRPRVIVALGSPAARTLLGSKLGITKIRGTWFEFEGIPVMPTFHPAYLLRAYTEENRRAVWSDLKAARTRMDERP
jgi:DNA polymerase